MNCNNSNFASREVCGKCGIQKRPTISNQLVSYLSATEDTFIKVKATPEAVTIVNTGTESVKDSLLRTVQDVPLLKLKSFPYSNECKFIIRVNVTSVFDSVFSSADGVMKATVVIDDGTSDAYLTCEGEAFLQVMGLRGSLLQQLKRLSDRGGTLTCGKSQGGATGSKERHNNEYGTILRGAIEGRNAKGVEASFITLCVRLHNVKAKEYHVANINPLSADSGGGKMIQGGEWLHLFSLPIVDDQYVHFTSARMTAKMLLMKRQKETGI